MGIRVLVVDDDALVRELLRRVLSDTEVRSVATAQEGMEIASEWLPHVAVVDVRLARSSGLHLIAPLRQASPGIVVVVLTAHPNPVDEARALRDGAYCYAQKTEAQRVRQLVLGALAYREGQLH